VGLDGLDHAHVEDGNRVEDEPRDLKTLAQVLAPGEEDVRDEDIGRGLFQHSFHLSLDEVRRHVDFVGGVAGGGRNEIFHAFRETHMGVGEFDEVDADVVAGGYVVLDGSFEELGIAGSGDDGHVLAT